MNEFQPQQSPPATPAPMMTPVVPPKSSGPKKGITALLIVLGVLTAGYLVYPYVAAVLYFADPFAPSGPKTYTNEQYGFSFTYSAGDFRVRKGTTSDRGSAEDSVSVVVLEDRTEGLGFGGGRTVYFEVSVTTESMDSIRSRYSKEVVERPTTVDGQPAYEVMSIYTLPDGKTFTSSRYILIPYRGVVYELDDREPALNIVSPILDTFHFTK